MKLRVTAGAATLALSFAIFLTAGPALAAGMHAGGHGHGHGFEFGQPGDPAKATRTVAVTMGDNFFEPETLKVKAGETIRFVIENKGQLVHEFNLGTAAMHEAHRAEMQMMVDHGVLMPDRINREMMKMDMGGGKTMEHNDPNSKLVEPGKKDEIVWTFTKAMSLQFSCNVPGHSEAGMVGDLKVER